jgi:hypothetical protein
LRRDDQVNRHSDEDTSGSQTDQEQADTSNQKDRANRTGRPRRRPSTLVKVTGLIGGVATLLGALTAFLPAVREWLPEAPTAAPHASAEAAWPGSGSAGAAGTLATSPNGSGGNAAQPFGQATALNPGVPAVPTSPPRTGGSASPADAGKLAQPQTEDGQNPTPCSNDNAAGLIVKPSPGAYQLHLRIVNFSYVAIDSRSPRYAQKTNNAPTDKCQFNFDLNNHQLQPLGGSLIGDPQSNGKCGPIPPGARNVERNVSTKLCGWSDYDRATFEVSVKLDDTGWWTIDGIITVQ